MVTRQDRKTEKKSRGLGVGMKLLAPGSSLFPADVRQETSVRLIKPRLPTEGSLRRQLTGGFEEQCVVLAEGQHDCGLGLNGS